MHLQAGSPSDPGSVEHVADSRALAFQRSSRLERALVIGAYVAGKT